MQNLNPDSQQRGETYKNWGLRLCGKVGGSVEVLTPYLQMVYNNTYRKQADDVMLQEIARNKLQAEIEHNNSEIETTQHKISMINDEIDNCRLKIDTLKEERQEIINSKERVNKEQRIKLILGIVILIPLTFYLFLFYSSTFFSAFFHDANNMSDNVMNAMFDANALSNAANAGMAELGFVLSAPVIFLGLGFGLHFFAMQKGAQKYIKMGAILLVTFMFDCILAYLIGKQLHNLGIIIGSVPVGDVYSIPAAINDPNTGAVIFCGFIVYIIWGIVFDMTMSAYDKMDFNKTRLEEIKKDIMEVENKIQANKSLIGEKESSILQLRNETRTLTSRLGQEICIDYSIIKTNMTEFFAGWITQMNVLCLPSSNLQQAQQIFDSTIQSLITT